MVTIISETATQAVRFKTTVQSVVPLATAQYIVGGIAFYRIIKFITHCIDCIRACQNKILQIRSQGVIECTVNGIRTFLSIFRNDVPGIIDIVTVVARTTVHNVRPNTTVQGIVPLAASQDICRCIALYGVI